ncbi:MAG: HIT family protein [Candidatus Aenigmarchaeota archaeon]|nr:HIT family protein [Candidatus Aenigmarchaeota archaeon]
MEECLFCKIAAGKIPIKRVYEDEHTVAFLDINPASEGHTLVIPKKHAATIMEMDEDDLKHLSSTVRKLSSHIMSVLKPEGINILQNNGKAAGQLVHHVHFHIIPRNEGDKITIAFPRGQTDETGLETTKLKIAITSSGNKQQSHSVKGAFGF